MFLSETSLTALTREMRRVSRRTCQFLRLRLCAALLPFSAPKAQALLFASLVSFPFAFGEDPSLRRTANAREGLLSLAQAFGERRTASPPANSCAEGASVALLSPGPRVALSLVHLRSPEAKHAHRRKRTQGTLSCQHR